MASGEAAALEVSMDVLSMFHRETGSPLESFVLAVNP